jgi:hypothetical protein
MGESHLSWVTRWRRHIRMVLLWAIVLMVVLPAWPARPASAETRCAVGHCVLACDTRLRQCSMYSLEELTPRLKVFKFMPYGFTRVYSNSECERRVCTRHNAACYPFP